MATKKLIETAKKHADEFLCKKNVVGVGAGEERKKNCPTGCEAIVVLVRKKEPKSMLKQEDLLPDTVVYGESKIEVDVIEVGDIRIQNQQHRFNHRPLVAGVSCGHFATTAGTLGLFVEKNGKPYILSNNHVLADSNRARIGDAILQPGPIDGGRSRHQVATLSEFVPIHFSQPNRVDAALAEVLRANETEVPEEPAPPAQKRPGLLRRFWEWLRSLFGGRSSAYSVNVDVKGGSVVVDTGVTVQDRIEFSNEMLGMVTPLTGRLSTVQEGDMVQKSGRTTGYTKGQVLALGASVVVDFGSQGAARFDDQIVTQDMSQGGDSGSVVFDMRGNAIGLLFAGSPVVTILNPIDAVFGELGITRIWGF